MLWERAFALNDTSFYPMKLVTLLRGTGHQLPALPSPVMDPPFLVFEGIAQVRPALGLSLLAVVTCSIHAKGRAPQVSVRLTRQHALSLCYRSLVIHKTVWAQTFVSPELAGGGGGGGHLGEYLH